MRVIVSKEELDSSKKNGGLEIFVEGCKGDLEAEVPGYVVWIENHNGTIRCHAWNGIDHDPVSTTLM